MESYAEDNRGSSPNKVLVRCTGCDKWFTENPNHVLPDDLRCPTGCMDKLEILGLIFTKTPMAFVWPLGKPKKEEA